MTQLTAINSHVLVSQTQLTAINSHVLVSQCMPRFHEI